MVGAYAIAGVTSHGSERVLRQTEGVGPSTIIITTKYCIRTGRGRVRISSYVSVILNGGGGRGLVRTLRRCREARGTSYGMARDRGGTGGRRGSEGTRVGVRRVKGAGRCRGLRLAGPKSRAETCVGIRSKYGRFYACYVVPCTHKEIHDHSVRSILSRMHALTSGKCGRIMLAKVRLDSCKVSFSGRCRLLRLVQTIRRVSKVREVHLNSLRPKVVARRFTRKVTGLPGVYPRFRLSLRDKYSTALGHVGHECADDRCTRGYRLLEGCFPGPTLAASIVIKFPKRARRRFGRSCSFISDVSFCRARVFGCSHHRKAGTTIVPSRMSRRVGTGEDTRLVRLNRGGHTTCRRDFRKGRIRILIRRSLRLGKGRMRANRAGRCVGVTLRAGRGLGGDVMGIRVKGSSRVVR